MHAIGIDFGTTNSSIARLTGNGEVELAQFPFAGGVTEAWRSLLYLEQEKENGANRLTSWTGPEGIERYLNAEIRGRLIQSLKSFLTSRSLESTDVFGRRLKVEDLIARILRDLRVRAEAQFGVAIDTAVVGRPVNFVGAGKEEDNLFAVDRLAEAFFAAGFEEVTFELEPVAAAHHYESTLDHDELILIGDFGGGTSDFSLLRVGPGMRGLQSGGRRETAVRQQWNRFRGRCFRCPHCPQSGLAAFGPRVFGAVPGEGTSRRP